jgi:hypothetical protein
MRYVPHEIPGDGLSRRHDRFAICFMRRQELFQHLQIPKKFRVFLFVERVAGIAGILLRLPLLPKMHNDAAVQECEYSREILFPFPLAGSRDELSEASENFPLPLVDRFDFHGHSGSPVTRHLTLLSATTKYIRGIPD